MDRDVHDVPDGTERPWDWDTIREVAKLLTVDKNGKDANIDGFDPENIVQWGLEPQRDDLRQTRPSGPWSACRWRRRHDR